MLSAALFLAALAPPPAPPAEEVQEIVVTGTRPGKCRVRLADRALAERQFDEAAGEWARLGRAIRVVHPSRTSYACLARIAFRLERHGIRLVHFVERPTARLGSQTNKRSRFRSDKRKVSSENQGCGVARKARSKSVVQSSTAAICEAVSLFLARTETVRTGPSS
jgi:hypothetical protein